ncbi:MAG: DUF3027 domain-containing protein [Actinobacteria bacterium]|nr:DUF3027 domain-containing protein [Actinomycetota bacterium]MBI3688458.1 DUF3027 domain-containing protein [Actinomycetota bacterium]
MSTAVSSGALRTPSARAARPDSVCSAAVELARATAVDVAGDVVGEHVGVLAEGERLVTHLFESRQAGYRGWRWAVTVARVPRAKVVTVCEVCLLPGPDALLAPEWVPWSERLRPGDLGVGDLLPAAADDERLVPAYVLADDPAVEQVAGEIGLGRPRVMSRVGRLDLAERWYVGDGGPDTPMARQAPGVCGGCAFWLPLAGALAAMFGVCGNEFAPRDGMVVAADYGCGAHSEGVAAELLAVAGAEPAADRD